ncbi:TonB family protein [Novosphingobium sp. BL-52-GroH]|uniref:TonB family protein n=1 Tax=Novosphingobium sp. BL-52-GroH TaxID=3349877 RepID=UPI00384CE23E
MTSRDRYAPGTHDPADGPVMPIAGQAAPFAVAAPRETYAPDARGRLFAFAVTVALHGAALIAFMLFRSVAAVVAPPPMPLVVTLLPLASPPPQVREKMAKPRPAPRIPTPMQPPSIIAVPQPITPAAVSSVIIRSDPAPSAPASPASPPTVAATVETSAPVSDASSKAKDSWEGRVLAALERQKRYPAASRSRREQGVVSIRFRLNRDGRVLSSSIAQGSGFAALDHEALATLSRAEPLPQFPHDMPGDTRELVVPMQFFLR